MVFYIVLVILIVFAIGVISFLIYERQSSIKEIKEGYLDSELIYEDHLREVKNKKYKILKKSLDIGLDVLIALLGLLFLVGIVDKTINISSLPIKSVVIATGSMSEKNEENDYLFENHLDNQIQVNDLIFLDKVTSLDEVKLYDIICYENDENLRIVHRVVEVNENYLITRGDANNADDNIQIRLDDIVGKYNGIKIPGIGSFTFFLSSDYGISTISFILLLSIVYYFVKSSIEKVEDKRITYLKEEIKSLVSENETYELISSSGTLTVKENVYTFNENREENDISSLIKTEKLTKELKKEK